MRLFIKIRDFKLILYAFFASSCHGTEIARRRGRYARRYAKGGTRPKIRAPGLTRTRALAPLVRLREAQAAAILNHSRALPQRDGCIRPGFARRVEGGECNVIVLNARDVLDEA